MLEAVNANRPFLLDSTLAELVARGYQPRLVAHPILGVERDADGALVRVVGETTAQESGPDAEGLARESFIHVHLDRIDDEAARATLAASLARIYADVAVTAADHTAMVERLAEAAAGLAEAPAPLAREEVSEARAFLDWLRDGHFVLLGLREYRDRDGADHAGVTGSGLGLLRDPAIEVLRRGDAMVAVTPEIRAFLEGPEALLVTKASLRSRVRRQAHLDMVGIKLFASDGQLSGELRLVGLFTGSAYASRAEEVPYLRRKVARVVAKAGLDPTSHAGRSLLHVLETYPRDDLFQIEPASSCASRWPSCRSPTGRGCGCWQGPTSSAASSRCSPTCRRTAPTPGSRPGSAPTSRRPWAAASRPSRRITRRPARAPPRHRGHTRRAAGGDRCRRARGRHRRACPHLGRFPARVIEPEPRRRCPRPRRRLCRRLPGRLPRDVFGRPGAPRHRHPGADLGSQPRAVDLFRRPGDPDTGSA